MPKGTSWAEAMSNSEKIESIPSAIASLKASGKQAVSQLVENPFK